MREYDPRRIEPEWQARWARAGAFRAGEPAAGGARFYCLEMLPYPSGRLHMGHVRNYSIGDAIARFRRMRGERVMHVIGWDAFGMPAENAAIRHGEHPGRWTRRNIAAMRAQMERLGLGYEWEREIATCDPSFYRWNQWFFLRMLERDLAFRDRRRLNWCPSCETVLANEQVVDGLCWRCHGPVEMREFDQWFLRITRYAQELLDDLERLPDWPERVRTMQRNWLGRSDGARLSFRVEGSALAIEVFTTRIDTIYGATYVALAAEHPAIPELVRGRPEEAEVARFVATERAKNVVDRFGDRAEKLGVFTGRHAVNPFNGERLPLWVANFVLMDVGTGAIMSVPAHDQRDLDFARAHGLPVRPVVHPPDGARLRAEGLEAARSEAGRLEDSGPYSGLDSATAVRRMLVDAGAAGFGKEETVWRLKDWGISRQRLWGTPIPVVHCERCGAVGVPDDQLPVVLPEDAPLTGEGGSPLGRVAAFVLTACPRCGGPGRRETDTMDTFVDSSWYYFRYLDPGNDAAPFDAERVRGWLPVDLYIGGIEHATLHLIYTRFWTKMMRDLGLVAVGEPVRQLFTQGMVIKDGAKMSKSKGNIVDPDHLVDAFGADTTRLFSLFAAPPEKDLDWSDAGVEGCSRFLHRVHRVFRRAAERLPERGAAVPAGAATAEVVELRRKTHDTIRRVTEDIAQRMRFNTAIAAIMELTNVASPLAESGEHDPVRDHALREAFETLALLLVPFAPHFAEELWSELGGEGLACLARWPEADPALLERDSVTLVVQVNGKLRGRVVVPRDCPQDEAMRRAAEDPNVALHLAGRPPERAIYVPGRLLNLVVG